MSKKGVAFENKGGDASDSEGEMGFAPSSVHFEDPDTFISKLSEPVQKRVFALQFLQGEHEKIQKEYQKEIEEILKKYEARWQPLYARRAEIVNGKSLTEDEAVKAEELKASAKKPETEEKKDEKAEKDEKTESNNNNEDNGVPSFWLRVLQNNDIVGENITEKDEEALKFLTDIRSVEFENKDEEGKTKEKGFKLEFDFSENPFFNNKVLTKTYFMIDDGASYDLEKAEGTKVEWKEGKNLTVKTVQKKQKHKGGKGTRVVTKEEPCDSFFNFFAPPQRPDVNMDQDEEIDEEELEAIEEAIDADYEIGQTISERLVKDAVNYYTGARLAELLAGYAFDGGDDEDEEDEDEEEAPQQPKANKKKGNNAPQGGAAGGAGAGGEDKPECKTQ